LSEIYQRLCLPAVEQTCRLDMAASGMGCTGPSAHVGPYAGLLAREGGWWMSCRKAGAANSEPALQLVQRISLLAAEASGEAECCVLCCSGAELGMAWQHSGMHRARCFGRLALLTFLPFACRCILQDSLAKVRQCLAVCEKDEDWKAALQSDLQELQQLHQASAGCFPVGLASRQYTLLTTVGAGLHSGKHM